MISPLSLIMLVWGYHGDMPTNASTPWLVKIHVLARGIEGARDRDRFRAKDVTLWLFNSSPWYRWPIEIDGLPIKHGWIFPWLC